MLRKLLPAFLACLLCAAGASGVLADGDSRPASPAEKEFFRRVLAACERAVSPVQPGWDLVEKTEVSPPEHVSQGAEQFPLIADYRIAWEDRARSQTARDKLDQDLQRVVAANKPEAGEADLQRRLMEKAQALGQAVEAGRLEEAQRLEKEMEALAAQLNQIYKKRDQAINSAVAAGQPRDVTLQISIRLNSTGESFPRRPALEPAGPGGATVYRVEAGESNSENRPEGTSYVFLGQAWKYVAQGSSFYMEAPPRAGLSHLVVQTVTVRVQAEPERAGRVLASLDWAALKCLLEK